MDIYCPKCGEPWEIDSFHEKIVEEGYDFGEAKAMYPDSTIRQMEYEKQYWNPMMTKFRQQGCGVVFEHDSCKPRNNGVTAASAAAFELMGDDVDGIASMMEDAEMMGMFDD